MDNNLINRETLSQFVDELIKRKPLPIDSAEDLANLREDAIKALDDRIGMAIFGKFTEEQSQEYNQILDRGEENPDVFEDFFNRAGLDVEKIITETMDEFANEFLEGGQNVWKIKF